MSSGLMSAFFLPTAARIHGYMDSPIYIIESPGETTNSTITHGRAALQ
eukprot:COSAG01_NODE_2845_length_6987_cov_19.830139_7_plen_48_part_00